MAMNVLIAMGRLTKDPDFRMTESGSKICRYSLAVDRYRKDQDNDTDFIPCVCFGKQAEFADKYFQKGTKILIRGSMKSGKYENRDGKTVYTLDCWVESQEFAGAKSDGSGAGQRQTAAAGPAGYDGFMNIPDGVDDEGLPFS